MMVRIKNCAICKQAMVLDFDWYFKPASCPKCGAAFQYRLLGSSIYEIVKEPISFRNERIRSAI